MSGNRENKVHVVFVGRKSGIYFTYDEALEQVRDFTDNCHRRYESYDEAEQAFVDYCLRHGRDPGFVPAHLQTNAGLFDNRGKMNAKVPQKLAVDTSYRDFILQESMTKLLKKLCVILQVGQPVFTLHEVKTVNNVQFIRYCASVDIGKFRDPIISVGKFAKDDYATTEDVAVLLAQELCNRTGKEIRDFNFYNVQMLEAKVEALMDANVKLTMQLAMLKEANKGNSSGPRFV